MLPPHIIIHSSKLFCHVAIPLLIKWRRSILQGDEVPRCGDCFPGCLLPSLCGECIGIGLGFGTHGFGFGHCAGWKFCDTGNRPLPHLPRKTRRNGTTQQNTTQRNATQSTRKQRKKESLFLPPSRAGEKLEAGISKPLIASSSSRGIKARGRDLQVPLSVNWTQTTTQATKRGFKDCPGFLNSTGRLGPKRGRKCYITPAFSGVPNKGNKIKTQNLRRGSP